MTQEININITAEALTELDTFEIAKALTQTLATQGVWIQEFELKEEAEIYNNQ